jgi:hypothetical protein
MPKLLLLTVMTAALLAAVAMHTPRARRPRRCCRQACKSQAARRPLSNEPAWLAHTGAFAARARAAHGEKSANAGSSARHPRSIRGRLVDAEVTGIAVAVPQSLRRTTEWPLGPHAGPQNAVVDLQAQLTAASRLPIGAAPPGEPLHPRHRLPHCRLVHLPLHPLHGRSPSRCA